MFTIPRVRGVGIGHKHAGGKYTNRLSIKVYVTQKIRLAEISSADVIPTEIDGVPTDVVESGPPQLSADPDTNKRRPVRGGTQIQVMEVLPDGHTTATTNGTLGFFARTTTNPSILVGVTNHHVLAPTGTLTKGQAVGQSSPKEYTICSKCCSEIIGVILDGMNTLAVDVGLITLNRKLDYYNQVQDEPDNFLVKGAYSLQKDGIPASPYHVKKRGATTLRTTGVIDSIHATFADSNNVIQHTDVIAIRPDSGVFNQQGDSGSAVVSTEGADDGKIIGLLFGTNPQGFGFACDIDVVQTHLAGLHFPIEILTASQLGNKQTVPDTDTQANAYRVAGAQEEEQPLQVPALENQWLQRAQSELLQTTDGHRYVGLFQQHHEEVRTLIDTNKRVATMWHRNCGPALIQTVLNTLHSPEQPIPTEIGGRPLAEILNRIMAAFAKYGSAELARDLMAYGAPLARLGGHTYDQILGALRTGVFGNNETFTEAGV